MGPQFVIHGLPTIEKLDENTGICGPATRIRRSPNITHESTYVNAVGKGKAVGDKVGYHREENYKTDFEIWNENSKLQSERENIETI